MESVLARRGGFGHYSAPNLSRTLVHYVRGVVEEGSREAGGPMGDAHAEVVAQPALADEEARPGRGAPALGEQMGGQAQGQRRVKKSKENGNTHENESQFIRSTLQICNSHPNIMPTYASRNSLPVLLFAAAPQHQRLIELEGGATGFPNVVLYQQTLRHRACGTI